MIEEIKLYKAGEQLPGEKVNHYVTDGEVAAADLTVKA